MIYTLDPRIPKLKLENWQDSDNPTHIIKSVKKQYYS